MRVLVIAMPRLVMPRDVGSSGRFLAPEWGRCAFMRPPRGSGRSLARCQNRKTVGFQAVQEAIVLTEPQLASRNDRIFLDI